MNWKHTNFMDLQYIDLRTVPHLPLASENIFRGGARCSIEKGVSGYNCLGKFIATKPPRSPQIVVKSKGITHPKMPLIQVEICP